jgi:hypothetical protein
MKRFLLALLPVAALPLGGCMEMAGAVAAAALSGGGSRPAPAAVVTASAPLARTTFDESAYRTVLTVANTARLSINVLIARKVLVKNTPKALGVRDGLIALKAALVAGRSLLDALNDPVSSLSIAEFNDKAAQYRKAMADATAAAEKIGEALGDSFSEVRPTSAPVAQLAAIEGDVDATIGALGDVEIAILTSPAFVAAAGN